MAIFDKVRKKELKDFLNNLPIEFFKKYEPNKYIYILNRKDINYLYTTEHKIIIDTDVETDEGKKSIIRLYINDKFCGGGIFNTENISFIYYRIEKSITRQFKRYLKLI